MRSCEDCSGSGVGEYQIRCPKCWGSGVIHSQNNTSTWLEKHQTQIMTLETNSQKSENAIALLTMQVSDLKQMVKCLVINSYDDFTKEKINERIKEDGPGAIYLAYKDDRPQIFFSRESLSVEEVLVKDVIE